MAAQDTPSRLSNQSDDHEAYGTFEADALVVGESHDGSGDMIVDKRSDSYHALVDLADDEVDPTIVPGVADNDDNDNKKRRAFWKYVAHVVYLSEFAILGSILRVFLGRFFGGACESQQQQGPFLCWTHSGKYGPGGYLFIDLPANLLGSFVMGVLNPLDPQHSHAMPWFHRHHILQTHDAFVTGLRTGVCGSLTTFSSWNTQMVVMIHGSASQQPQIASAIYGYLIGFFGAAVAYIAGSFVHNRWTAYSHRGGRLSWISHPPHNNNNPRFSQLSFNTQIATAGWAINYLPLILCVALFLGFGLIGDGHFHDSYFRTLWLSCAVSPMGAILRWRLAQLNEWSGRWKRLEFIPWGTFLANMLAVCLSVTTEATNAQLKTKAAAAAVGTTMWLSPVLSAMQTGFGGSLSTVSTWLKEIFAMNTTMHAVAYASGTILCGVALGLVVYGQIL